MTSAASARIAPISRRVIGYLIDAFVATALAILLYGGTVVAATIAGSDGMLGVLALGGSVATFLLLGWFLLYTFLQSRSGSLGMRAQGLRLVREADEAPLGFPRALLRNVVFGLAGSIVVGYFTPLFDGSGRFQGWHDKAARSLMVDARTPASGPAAAVASTEPLPGARTEAPPTVPPSATAARAGTPSSRADAPVPQTVTEPDPSSRTTSAPARPAADEGLIAYVPGVTPPASAPPSTPAPVESADLDQTVVGPPAAATRTPPAAESPPPAVAPAPVTAPAAASTADPDDEDDLEDTRISIPGHRLVFTWDDGTRVSVSRVTVFGRNPAAQDGAVLVPVRDETLSLSKTHFEAAAEPSGGWILDRHSTNGTTLVRGGQRIACPPGQRVPLRLGDVIEIGDRVVTVGGYA